MRIEATTQISFESYRKYFLFQFFQGKRSRWQAPLLIVVAPAMFIYFLIMYIQNPADYFNLFGAFLMAGMGFVLLYILTIMPRRYYRSVQRKIEIPHHYVFTDEQMEVSWTDPQTSGQSATRYEMILKAVETKDSFYIYIAPSQAYLIGKSDITAGSAPDLHELLLARLGARLIQKN